MPARSSLLGQRPSCGSRRSVRFMRRNAETMPVGSAISAGERQQILLRLVIGAGVVVYVIATAAFAPPSGAQAGSLLPLATAFAACAACLYGWFRAAPEPNKARAIAGLVLDIATLSLFLGVGDALGAPLFPIYLWVIFGNGI